MHSWRGGKERRSGEIPGLGDRRPTFQLQLYHTVTWYCLREITSLPSPWLPIHKMRGFGLVGLLRQLGSTISTSSRTLSFVEEGVTVLEKRHINPWRVASQLLGLDSDFLVWYILSGDSIEAALVYSLTHGYGALVMDSWAHVSTLLRWHRRFLSLGPLFFVPIPHNSSVYILVSQHHRHPNPSSSCVQPLEWVGNSQWHSVQLLDGGGGGGESALNPVLVRMLLVAETKPWLKLAQTIGNSLSHISGIPGGRADPKLVELAIQQWYSRRESLYLLCSAFISWILSPAGDKMVAAVASIISRYDMI